MRTAHKAMALVLAISLGAHAEGRGHHDSGIFILDLILDIVTIAAIENAVQQQPPPPPPQAQGYAQQDPPPQYLRPERRRFQARQGLLLSFGLGGGSMYASTETPGYTRTGAFDLDFRLGYGFSDRFQLFMDLNMDAANYATNGSYYAASNDVASWTFTFRGQTVLIGDRAGNGLNLNAGVGLGGITRNSGYYDQSSSPSGLALAGGLSYDARISPWFALSPEFFWTWHSIPTVPGAHDAANIYGLRVNFLWYLH